MSAKKVARLRESRSEVGQYGGSQRVCVTHVLASDQQSETRAAHINHATESEKLLGSCVKHTSPITVGDGLNGATVPSRNVEVLHETLGVCRDKSKQVTGFSR
jgi:hypothetical protein